MSSPLNLFLISFLVRQIDLGRNVAAEFPAHGTLFQLSISGNVRRPAMPYEHRTLEQLTPGAALAESHLYEKNEPQKDGQVFARLFAHMLDNI